MGDVINKFVDCTEDTSGRAEDIQLEAQLSSETGWHQSLGDGCAKVSEEFPA